MLSRKDNNYITEIGPGTPMGNLFRRYWLPALLAEELPEADCPPDAPVHDQLAAFMGRQL